MHEYLLVGWFDSVCMVYKMNPNVDELLHAYRIWKKSTDKVWLFRREHNAARILEIEIHPQYNAVTGYTVL